MAFVGGQAGSGRQTSRRKGPLSGALGELRRDDARHPAAAQAGWQGLLWATALLIGAICLLTICGLGLLVYHSDLILPGVRAGDVDLGTLTRSEAASAVSSAWSAPTIAVQVGETARPVAANALGIVLDSAVVAQTAHGQSRRIDRLARLLTGDPVAEEVEPVWRVDREVAIHFLQALARDVDVAPIDADLQIVNGAVQVTPAVTGRSLDVASTLVQLAQEPDMILAAGRFAPVMLVLDPALRDLSLAQAQASDLLAHSITIQAYDPIRDETLVWEAPPTVWAGWLQTEIEPASGALIWQIEAQRAQDYLAARMETLEPDRYLALPEGVAGVVAAIEGGRWRVDLRIYHHMRQHKVRPGDTLARIGREYGIPYPWIEQANPWADGGLMVGQVLTIPSPDELLPLPIVPDRRIVVSISRQRMWVYEEGEVIWEWPVSTGIESSPTHPGVFQVQSHEANAYAASWDLWMPHFMGIYRPVPTVDFMNGFHGFPSRAGTQLMWTGDLGRPVTYGCILIHSDNAAALYDWAEEGTVVQVDP
jgi:lipoprotein-anchoring transpeptidase ErfK/SrfK